MSGTNPIDACGANTSFDTSAMKCVGTLTCDAPSTYCGSDTTYDTTAKKCVSALSCASPASYCGDATVFDATATKCLGDCAAPATFCGAGTYFDVGTQRCLPGVLTATPTTTFADGTDGWSIVDLNGATIATADYVTVVNPLDITWNPSGGVADGAYLSRRDVTSKVFFFAAPPKFLGDQAAFRLGTLTFSMKTDGTDYIADAFVVLIGDGGKVAVGPIAKPTSAWTSYAVAFDVTQVAWRADRATGALLTQPELDAVLADLEALRINGEWGGNITETTGLDEVALVLP